MLKHRGRRKRRQAKATLKHGEKAKRSHRRTGGRTGQIMSKRTPASRVNRYLHLPNPPPPEWMQ